MKGKIFKKVVAMLIIASLTMGNLLILGENIAIAVYENLENQSVAINSYIDYDVYFKEDKQKIHSKTANIKEGASLYININVKDTGVALDAGKIKINSNNFKLGKVKSTAIKSINYETNEIELNEIVYGNNIEIKLPITFEKSENIDVDYFDAINTINLEGTYRNAKSSKNINAKRQVELAWTEEADTEVTQKIEKYMLIENEGVMLQDCLEVKVIDNVLPKESENVAINVPQIEGKMPEKVTVLKNGKKIDNINYNSENGTLKIETKNTVWNNGVDEYKVIYIYNEEIGDISRNVTLDATVETKLYTKENAIQKTSKNDVAINKIGNIASIKHEITQEQYKGYMYANVENETEYEEVSTIEISNVNAGEIELTSTGDNYVDENGNKYNSLNATYFKQTLINKEEMLKVLGNNAQITIENANGEIVSILNSESNTDENGNIVVEYNGNAVNKIKVKTSSAELEGSLKITNKKIIKGNTGYTKGQLKIVKGLESNVQLVADGNQSATAIMNLKDTTTEADITLSQTTLSTLNENNILIDINLKANENKHDLYKNPTINIKLPKEVIKFKVNSVGELYKSGFVLQTSNYDEETRTLSLTYTGEQTQFGNAVQQGMHIQIDATATLNRLSTTRASKIIMTYTNENGNGNPYTKTVDINVNSKAGILTYSTLSGYNGSEYVEAVGEDIVEAKLNEQTEAKKIQAKMAVINNYGIPVTDVSIIGKVAKKENKGTLTSTLETKLVEKLQTIPDVKVYYSEEENAVADSNSWKEEVEDLAKVRSYKIVPNESRIEANSSMAFIYSFEIPENLSSNQSTFTNYEVNYTYAGQKVKTNSSVILATETQESAGKVEEEVVEEQVEQAKNVELEETTPEGTTIEIAEGLELNYSAISARKELKEGEEVDEGQTVKYTVKLTNNTGKDISNLKLTAEQTNAVFYGIKYVKSIWVTLDNQYNKYVEEDESLKNKEHTVELLKDGEETEFSYEFTVKQANEGDKTEGNLKITADNLDEKETKLYTNIIKDASLKLILKNRLSEDMQIYSDECSWLMYAKVTNITEENLENVIVEIPLQDWIYAEGPLPPSDGKYTIEDYSNNTLKFKIANISPNEEVIVKAALIFTNMDIKKEKDNFELDFIAYEENKQNKKYISNKIEKSVIQNKTKLEITQTASKENGATIEEGEEITFNACVKNEGIIESNVTIQDNMTDGLEVTEAFYEHNGEIKEFNAKGLIFENLKPNEVINVTVKARNNSEKNPYINKISSEFEVISSENHDKTDTLKYKLARSLDVSSGIETEEIEDKNELEENESNTKFSFVGTVWEDENKNGRKDENVQVQGIDAYLLDSNSGEVVTGPSRTDAEGSYTFQDVANGNYIVALDVDSSKYRPTTYQKNKAINIGNSNVVTKEVSINGEIKQMAVTDVIKVGEDNNFNIDAGLVEKENFDLRLDKYVTKVTVENNKGTKVKEYKDVKTAKVEIDKKDLENSLVTVEYTINVTNEGEVAGYVSEILDYIPNDLEFNETLNKDWYQTEDGVLHNITLANEKLEPGDTKEIKIILTKQMTEDNLGLIINSAEIGKTSNEVDSEDIDSITANKVDTEDDFSKAEVLVKVKTINKTIIIVIACLIAVIIIAVIIKNTKGKEDKHE